MQTEYKTRPAVLLINLGTPVAPSVSAVRAYLAEFLADRRVVDLPPAVWWPILHGIVLRTRPPKSAAKYAKIWTPHGSPLRVHTETQAQALSTWLQQQGTDIHVAWAMRYGEPSVAATLDRLLQLGAAPILVLPLYPQFSRSATASAFDAVDAWWNRRIDRQTVVPNLTRITEFHRDAGYIEAVAQRVREFRQQKGSGEVLVMSFHGIPQRAVERGDPYGEQCAVSAQRIAEALQLEPGTWRLTYQSRFGGGRWLQPATLSTLQQLAQTGVTTVDVVCPGFVADCLETLEEIDLECRAAFLAAGGRRFAMIPCLNEHPDWIAALGRLVVQALAA